MTKPVKDHVVTIFPDGTVTTVPLEKFNYMLVGRSFINDTTEVLKTNKSVCIRKDDQGKPYLEIERNDGTKFIVEKLMTGMKTTRVVEA